MRRFIITLLLIVSVMCMAFTPTITTSVTAAWTTICSEANIGRNARMQFKVHNTGTTNPFTDCQVQSWVGPAATDWVTISIGWTACQSLATGAMTTWEIDGSSHEKLRVQAKSAAGTSAYCRPYGN